MFEMLESSIKSPKTSHIEITAVLQSRYSILLLYTNTHTTNYTWCKTTHIRPYIATQTDLPISVQAYTSSADKNRIFNDFPAFISWSPAVALEKHNNNFLSPLAGFSNHSAHIHNKIALAD